MKNRIKKTEEEILKEKGLSYGLFDKDSNLIEIPEGIVGAMYDSKKKCWYWVDKNLKRIKKA